MFTRCREFSGKLLRLSCSISFKTSKFLCSPQLSASQFFSFHFSTSHSFFTSLFVPHLSFQHPLPSRSCFPVLWSDIRYLSGFTHPAGHMDLHKVLEVLDQLAPLSLAESWDNVGLLVEPTNPRPIKTILLTNDLTAAVMDEAVAMNCDLIVSYHPPLFRPFKRLLQKDWKQRLAVRAIEGGIAIFSPHTSWDSVEGGVNDWLVGGMGKKEHFFFSVVWVKESEILTCASIHRQRTSVSIKSSPLLRPTETQAWVLVHEWRRTKQPFGATKTHRRQWNLAVLYNKVSVCLQVVLPIICDGIHSNTAPYSSSEMKVEGSRWT